MLTYNSINPKFLFFLLLIFTLKLPINNLIDFSLLIFGIFVILCCDTNLENKKNYLIIILIFIISIFSNFFSKDKIEEAHSVFFSLKDISIISNFLPDNLIDKMSVDYKNNFNINRALESYDADNFSTYEKFSNYKFIQNPYAFSSDNFLSQKKLTRNVNKINFNNREELRIGQMNSLQFNLVFDKELRRMLPYYVLYKIPNSYRSSEICGNGNLYYYFSNNENEKIKDIQFNKLESKCLILDDKFKNYFIFGYSINKKDNLQIKLNENFFESFSFFLIIFFKICFLILFLKFFFFIKIKNLNNVVFFLSILSTFIFLLLKDINLINGLRYYRGGGDGLFHEFQGYEIVRNLYNFNFSEALRGGENYFYNMPGLRYFISINKIFFGETAYGYIIVGILLPFFLFNLLSNLISTKISFYLILSFFFLPVFENMGFAHFNYIHQIVRNHAETLAILFIIFSLSKLTNQKFIESKNAFFVFFICLLLSLSTFCRPNFFPSTLLIFIYLILFYRKDLTIILSATIGYSFIFLSFIHNIYFSESLSFFTRSDIHFAFNDIFYNLNSVNENNIIFEQFLKWNPYYNFHRLLILIFIIYCFFRFTKNSVIILLFSMMISQHLVLLITHPDSRYAYLAWLLTIMIFFYYFFNKYLYKLK